MTTYKKFTLSEWQTVTDKAKAQYLDSLGKRPTKGSVKKEIVDNNRLDSLNQIAILLLIIISIFTGFKAVFTSVPLSESMIESILHKGAVPQQVLLGFQISIAVTFVLATTFSLIYFKLLAEHPNTMRKKLQSKRESKWSLEYWSPRLPSYIVYLSIALIVIISNQANKTIADWVFNNLIVLAELGLSYPVARWLAKTQARGEMLSSELLEQRTQYDNLVANYESQPIYLRNLFQLASEALFNLEGDSRRDRPNAELRNADVKLIEQIIAREYQRLNGGVAFSANIANWLQADLHKGVNNNIATEIENAKGVEKLEKGEPRVPPNGAKSWTHETLYADLVKHNVPHGINEHELSEMYAPNYGTRKVWRNSVKATWD